MFSAVKNIFDANNWKQHKKKLEESHDSHWLCINFSGGQDGVGGSLSLKDHKQQQLGAVTVWRPGVSYLLFVVSSPNQWMSW